MLHEHRDTCALGHMGVLLLPNLWSLHGLPQPSQPSHTLHPVTSLFPSILSLGWHASTPPAPSTGAWTSCTLFRISLLCEILSSMKTRLWCLSPPRHKNSPPTVLRNICWISQWVKFILNFYYHDMFIILLFQNKFKRLIWLPHGKNCLNCQVTDCSVLWRWVGDGDQCPVCVCKSPRPTRSAVTAVSNTFFNTNENFYICYSLKREPLFILLFLELCSFPSD